MISLTIIIPTLNEAEQIVEALLAARAVAPGAEIIVADGGSSDATAALAAAYARVIMAPQGPARQMNAGASVAAGEALLFLHADTRLPAGAAGAIAAALADPQVIGGGFGLRFDERGLIYRIIAWSTTARSHARRAFTGDQAIFVRAAAFRALGGYADIPLMEDSKFSRRLRAAGPVRARPAGARLGPPPPQTRADEGAGDRLGFSTAVRLRNARVWAASPILWAATRGVASAED